MPKSTKKQKEKSSDFKKAKLKLGKGKKPANNAVDTSFKAHSIALPTQSIMVEKAGPTTKKHQSLSDLLSLLKHYSANSRKDALMGLRELFSAYADAPISNISTVLLACCKLISDEDGSVRKSNMQFMDWYLHNIPQKTILPHSATLMLYVTSALTHIFPEIRVDTIKLLDILLDVCPAIVVSPGPTGHADRVLQGYLSLLVGDAMRVEDGFATTSPAVVLSAQSKLSAVASLAQFLQAIKRNMSSDDDLWYLRGSFTSGKAYQSFVELLSDSQGSTSLVFMPETEPSLSPKDYWLKTENWTIEDIEHSLDFCQIDDSDITETDNGSLFEKAEKHLHRLLVELCLEYVPPAMMTLDSRAEPSTELRIVNATLKLAKSLYFDVHDSARSRRNYSQLLSLMSHISTYLPVMNEGDNCSTEVADELQAINLTYSELLAICLLSPPNSAPLKRDSIGKLMSRSLDVGKEISRVAPWILGMIRGRPTARHSLGRPLSAQTTSAILPTIWAMISHSPSIQAGFMVSTQLDILRAVVEQIQRPEISYATKLLLIRSLMSLLLIETEASYQGSFRPTRLPHTAGTDIGSSSAKDSRLKLFEDSILNIPKLLWELGDANPKTSRCLILYLLRCAQRKALDITNTTVLQISQRLIPFFCVQHPTRGTLLGPFVRFSGPNGVNTQKLALDLVLALGRYHINPPGSNKAQDIDVTNSQASNLLVSVTNSVANTVHKAYWESLQSRL
ncbi:hypothetical protein FRC19_009501 [Serendipita sp. 401]|nr:hypothetical protein FRC19_009501 [Serendipita sp. 401]